MFIHLLFNYIYIYIYSNFVDIDDIDLAITNSIFKNNVALFGGALSISCKRKHKYNIRSLSFNDIIFDSNVAERYGGALYFENSFSNINKIENLKFINNTAEIAGGAIYTIMPSSDIISNKKKNEFINIYEKMEFINNKASSYGNNYASPPTQVYLTNTYLYNNNKDEDLLYKIASGSYLPLSFNLTDYYDQYIPDNKYYHSNYELTARIYKIEEIDLSYEIVNNINNSTLNTTAILENSRNHFFNGKCELNNLKIFANTGLYKIKFKIEDSSYNEINLIPNDISLNVSECQEGYIVMLNKYNITYCEKPICINDCINGNCVYNMNNYIPYQNNPLLNKCKCNPGYNGELCSIPDIADYG